MKTPDLLTERFERNISGVIGYFNRVVLYGTYRPIQYPKEMGYHLYSEGVKLIDYEKQFANKLRLQLTGRTKEASLLRLIRAILMEVSEKWESADKAYLKMKTD